jgi:diaminopimelate decarboxylase
MSVFSLRGPTAAARRPLDRAPALPCVDDLVASFRPTEPLICLRPATITTAAETFIAAFPGDTLYAVKCNPDPAVLRALWEGGVRHFDCASLAEVELIRGMFPAAGIYFMHPIKSRPAIAQSYTLHDVRAFVFDSATELAKIRTETNNAGDLDLIVRIALPPLGAIMAEIETSVEALNLPAARLWAEPGRALVAAGTSVVVQVQGRRDRALYINDGVFGTLSDGGAPGYRYPSRLLRPSQAAPHDFAFWGPTCDSNDFMRGPFVLPADVTEGDWLEIGQLGAYGAALRTAFNGFDRAQFAEVRDAPIK